MTEALTDAQLLRELVAFDSTSTNSNLPIADFICDYLDASTIEVVRLPNEGGTKVNLVLRIAGAAGEHGDDSHDAGLMLCGHLDVVPAAEPEWRTDPFTLSETEDEYLGRGVCDMKGFVALAVNAARRASAALFKNPLVLLLTFDEELGTLGAQHFVETWKRPFQLPRSVVVGEPTELRAVRMHKGHLTLRITFRGRSAHSGYPHLGRNAIEPAARAVTALSKLRQELEKRRHSTSVYFPDTPYVALGVTEIAGGTAVNIVPDRCEINLSVRLLPGLGSAEIIDEVRSAIDRLDDAGDCSVTVTNESPPLLLPEDTPIHRDLCGLIGQSDSRGVSYASDAGPLQRMGLDCVLFGPGTIEVAHRPNESLPKSEFARAGEILDQLVSLTCGR